MKKILQSAWYSFLLVISLNAAAFASDITLSGAAYFKCDFLSKYMVKHGYFLIKESVPEHSAKTNLYAAGDAEIIIKNQNDAVIGKGKTDNKGGFSVTVPEENSYKIIFRFHGQEIEKLMSYRDTNNYIVDLGYFSTEKVGDWIDARLGPR